MAPLSLPAISPHFRIAVSITSGSSSCAFSADRSASFSKVFEIEVYYVVYSSGVVEAATKEEAEALVRDLKFDERGKDLSVIVKMEIERVEELAPDGTAPSEAEASSDERPVGIVPCEGATMHRGVVRSIWRQDRPRL